MKDMMDYKGYFGSVHYSDNDQVFYGKLENIKGLVNYEGTDVAGLRQEFQEAVDDYLALCAEEGLEPERPFKGSFNVRTSCDLHRRAAMYALECGSNLNKVVTEALEQYLLTHSPCQDRIDNHAS